MGVDLIVGMDAIHAYGIDAIISRSMALITINKHEMAFPIEFCRSKSVRDPALSDSFPVLCDKNIIIPPFHEAPSVFCWDTRPAATFGFMRLAFPTTLASGFLSMVGGLPKAL